MTVNEKDHCHLAKRDLIRKEKLDIRVRNNSQTPQLTVFIINQLSSIINNSRLYFS